MPCAVCRVPCAVRICIKSAEIDVEATTQDHKHECTIIKLRGSCRVGVEVLPEARGFFLNLSFLLKKLNKINLHLLNIISDDP